MGDLLSEAGLTEAPKAKVAVFVGNAWDPQPGRETPWIDIARQLADDAGVAILGPSAKDAPPGTDTINRLIAKVDGPVLLLFDELLNLFSRHRGLGEPMHAFLHNIVRGFVGSNHRAAVISLPRSQVEMTDWDLQWQDKIVKIIGAVAKPLLVNDEGGNQRGDPPAAVRGPRVRRRRGRTWPARSPTGASSGGHNCLPNGPPLIPRRPRRRPRSFSRPASRRATRSTRPLCRCSSGSGNPYRNSSRRAARSRCWPSGFPRRSRTATSGRGGNHSSLSAPRRSTCPSSEAWCWDNSANRGFWRPSTRTSPASDPTPAPSTRTPPGCCGTSTVALERPSCSSRRAARSTRSPTCPNSGSRWASRKWTRPRWTRRRSRLEAKAFFIQRVGTDGFKVYHKAKIDKAVHDRRASLDEEDEVKPTIRTLVKEEIKRGASIPVEPFPADSSTVPDSPRLNLVVLDPTYEWDGGDAIRTQIAEWTKNRGKSSRLYPGALVWCVRKPGRDLRDKVELLLAWRRVQRDVRDGLLGADFERADHQEIQAKVAEAEDDAKDEVWAGYRFVVLADSTDPSGLKVIDLGRAIPARPKRCAAGSLPP